jgi:NAD(P)-dependent dehydrogenase (short-subunit alcohol dehydrogenase family)
LLDEGAKVFFSDINEKGLGQLNQVLDQYNSEDYALGHHDVSSEVSWNEVLKNVNSKFGKLNILLNSAGIALGGDVVSTGLDVWKKVHDVNLDSVFLGCKLAIPIMAEHEAGSIISISSISGIVAGWNTAAYNSSKAGVRHLSKSIALYCAKKGYNIRSNTIHPAFIDTPILDPHKQAFGEKEAIAKLSRQIPMNKIGDTDDVAYAVLYLASDESKFITGSEIVLDGGLSAM